MNNKDLKKMSRRDLVDIIYRMKKNEQELQEKIASLEEELQDKRIHISEAGSIADAAADITNIFSAAQTTADLYLNEIACMKEETEKECAGMIEDAEKKVEAVLADGKKQYKELAVRYKSAYDKLQKLCDDIEKMKEYKAKIERGMKDVQKN